LAVADGNKPTEQPGKQARIDGWENAEEAKAEILRSVERHGQQR